MNAAATNKQILERIRVWRRQEQKSRARMEEASDRMKYWIREAVAAGITSTVIADAAQVTVGRVSQLAPRPERVAKRAAKAAAAAETAETGETGETVEPAAGGPAAVELDPAAVSQVLSGRATVRQRRRLGRLTAFYDPQDGAMVDTDGHKAPAVSDRVGPVGSVAHLLACVAALGAAHGVGVGRVYLIGPRPVADDSGATMAEATRAWALADPGPGWAAGAHYLADPERPLLRFSDETGARVVVARAAAWWGETAADLDTCRRAWVGLAATLDAVPAFAGAGLADTPATTGRALWLRTIPEGRSWPVLSDELRELIAATTGQGRIERRPAPAGVEPADFTYLDGRLMYAALTWGMPVGEPRLWTGAELDRLDGAAYGKAIRGRGRWRITVTVPDGWAHLGMFAAPAAAGGWVYPCEPGQRFTCWADGCEVWAGLEHGWEPVMHEGITWAEGKPLDTWTGHLVKAWQRTQESPEPAAELAGRAIRSILLYGLGAFASRAHPVTRSARMDGPEPEIPAGTEVRRVGESLVWSEPGELSEWSAACAHPEWAATVWARARTRLLEAPGPGGTRVGALQLPADRVVALSTDALYLAGGDPGWPDDGKPGRFRSKGTRPGRFDWPASPDELYRLRDAAAAAGPAAADVRKGA